MTSTPAEQIASVLELDKQFNDGDLSSSGAIYELRNSAPLMAQIIREQQEVIKQLVGALEPFAHFACDEPHVGERQCFNCIARIALALATKWMEE